MKKKTRFFIDGSKFSELREAHRLDQEEFAELAGVSVATVKRWGRSKRVGVFYSTLKKIAPLFGMTRVDLASRIAAFQEQSTSEIESDNGDAKHNNPAGVAVSPPIQPSGAGKGGGAGAAEGEKTPLYLRNIEAMISRRPPLTEEEKRAMGMLYRPLRVAHDANDWKWFGKLVAVVGEILASDMKQARMAAKKAGISIGKPHNE